MEQTAHPLLTRIAKSLRVRIFAILVLIGLSTCLIIQYAMLANYEKRAVEVRTAEVTTQLENLCAHLLEDDYLHDPTSESVEDQLHLLAGLYDGRILVLDEDLRVIADTRDDAPVTGRILVAPQTVRALGGASAQGTYDDEKGFIEVTVPLTDTLSPAPAEGTGEQTRLKGVLYASVSTKTIAQTMEILRVKSNRIVLIIGVCVFFFAIALSEILLKPFDRITRAISEIKAGYSDEPISVPDYLETEHITGAFNQLQTRMKVLDDSRQEFVSNVSHELKTPITSMKVLADTLLSQPDAPAETYRDFLADISAEIDREDKIINDLLALVRMDKTATPMSITSTDINAFTEIILKRLRPIARQRNIDLTLESARQITAEIDEVKFSMVVSNLVENAIKYNTDGGWVRVSLDADLRTFIMKVSDSGIGMPQEALDQIYERFYRVDKSRARDIGGTGLGLSVARQAVLLHRGEIEAQSTEGVGTTFTVRIPLTYVTAESAQSGRKKTSWFRRDMEKHT